jgi:hypothetical protein
MLDLRAQLIVQADAGIAQQLQTFARERRLVCFAGLPGTGKSLLSHQLAHLAVTAGRTVHLLQWDVVRPVFEAHPTGQRYPIVQGLTHGIIRKAVGHWARHALVMWHRQHPAPQHLLIGETPFIGNRFIELAQPQDDAAEELLRGRSSLFVIPVPSCQVRQHIESERQRRSTNPVHHQEHEDAPPHVLQALWQELVRIAPRLGLPVSCHGTHVPYDPILYQGVYEALLRHRQAHIMPVDTLLPTATLSVYDFAIERTYITPGPEEVGRFIQAVEQRYPEPEVLQQEITQWYRV